MLSASAMIPCPANAASPWMRIGSARVRPRVAQAILLGADAPLHDGVHPLEVAGVEGEREVDAVLVAPLAEHAVDREAEVVLHVAAAVVEVGLLVQLVLELGEDLRGRLLEHVGQHVEPPAVRHPDHDLADARAGRPLDQPLEQRDQALGPFQREALRAEELVLQELLEHLGADHLLKDLDPIGRASAAAGCACSPSGFAASRAARDRGCARSARRSCGSRSRAAG